MKPIRMLAVAGAALALAGLGPVVSAQAATRQWTASFRVKGEDAAGYATAVSPDGSTVYVAGAADFGELQAYNAATGAVIWKYRFNGSETSLQSAFRSITVSPDGSTVFASGYTQIKGQGNTFAPALMAFNATTGAQLWQLIADGVGVTAGTVQPVAVSPDSATVYLSRPGGDLYAFNAATGGRLWVMATGGGDALAPAADGSTLFAAGVTNDNQPAATAYNTTTGAIIWQDTVSFSDKLTSATLSPDGTTLFVSGFQQRNGTSGRIITMAYDTLTGAQLWTKITGTPNSRSVDGLAATSSAVVVSATVSAAKNALSWQTVALDPATGATLWTRAQNGSDNFADATGLALSPDGSTAYVAGYVDDATAGEDMLTIGYDTATGAAAWTARYHPKLNNFAYAIGISPDGSRLFLTGGSNATGERSAMTTVAYGTS